MTPIHPKTPKAGLLRYVFVIAVLAAAVLYGRSRSGPIVAPYVRDIFPEAAQVEESDGIYTALTDTGELLGWAGLGSASGYGGPMLVVVGVDTDGEVVGARVVEHRETPVFVRMAKPYRFFASLDGESVERIDYDYEHVVGVTGASKSAGAITGGVRDAVTKIAARKLDIQLPTPRRPFEFGILEITILLLFAVGIGSQYVGTTLRERLRWVCQLTAILLVGFWTNSPLTLAKLTALMAGYFPSPRSNLSLYLLVAGFVLSVFVFGVSIYCTHVCPFGAVQRCVGLVGVKGTKLPPWSARLLRMLRYVVVFAAVVAALIVSNPALAGYEPFAVMFALKGTLPQWFLLLVVVLASLVIHRPWCHFLCPMRVLERILQDVRRRGMHQWKVRHHE